ncbi:MAG: hypothetical protein HQ547_01775 [Candidatus Omnitrophica bacterium]|nr:hypothetical protein [Candidatus Omnitrophota bacterium]
MENKKCLTCNEYTSCKDSLSSWFFFIIAIIATVAIRVVTVLTHLNPVYAKIAWYIGITGFFIFFVYKFRVGQERAKHISQRNLISKINNKKQLSDEDYSLMGEILCALTSKKERINYLIIFGLSAVALVLAVYMDFIR